MGKRHAAAQAGIARAQEDENLREAENRRRSAEEERQLLTSYLGTEDQVAGRGGFDVSPDVLRYTQRYAVDERTLLDIQAAGAGVKNQLNPFQSADNGTRGGSDLLTFGRGFANQANDLLAQAEAAARSGDIGRADELYKQAQQIISGVSPEAQAAYNLTASPDSAAKLRASSTEGRIVGRQLLTARELGDPNSATSTALRGRLLDPALAAIDENTRNAERAISAERSQIEGEIRQTSGGGPGVNERARLAIESRNASQAALQRAVAYTEAGQQKAILTAQVNQYMNEFSKRMAEDSVVLAQDWVNGSAGVRDIYQESLQRLDLFEAEILNQRVIMAQNRLAEERAAEGFRKEVRRGAPLGLLTAGGITPTGRSSGVGAGGSTPSLGESAASDVGASGSAASDAASGSGGFFKGTTGTASAGSATGGGGGGGALKALGSIFGF